MQAEHLVAVQDKAGGCVPAGVKQVAQVRLAPARPPQHRRLDLNQQHARAQCPKRLAHSLDDQRLVAFHIDLHQVQPVQPHRGGPGVEAGDLDALDERAGAVPGADPRVGQVVGGIGEQRRTRTTGAVLDHRSGSLTRGGAALEVWRETRYTLRSQRSPERALTRRAAAANARARQGPSTPSTPTPRQNSRPSGPSPFIPQISPASRRHNLPVQSRAVDAMAAPGDRA
jgi:hypothetical protein